VRARSSKKRTRVTHAALRCRTRHDTTMYTSFSKLHQLSDPSAYRGRQVISKRKRNSIMHARVIERTPLSRTSFSRFNLIKRGNILPETQSGVFRSLIAGRAFTETRIVGRSSSALRVSPLKGQRSARFIALRIRLRHKCVARLQLLARVAEFFLRKFARSALAARVAGAPRRGAHRCEIVGGSPLRNANNTRIQFSRLASRVHRRGFMPPRDKFRHPRRRPLCTSGASR